MDYPKEEWVIVKDGKMTKVQPLTYSGIEKYRDDGFTVNKSVTTPNPNGETTKITTYSPLTKSEHNEKVMAQQRALYSKRSSGRSTMRARKSNRLKEVY
jgi:hypothetical protein